MIIISSSLRTILLVCLTALSGCVVASNSEQDNDSDIDTSTESEASSDLHQVDNNSDSTRNTSSDEATSADNATNGDAQDSNSDGSSKVESRTGSNTDTMTSTDDVDTIDMDDTGKSDNEDSSSSADDDNIDTGSEEDTYTGNNSDNDPSSEVTTGNDNQNNNDDTDTDAESDTQQIVATDTALDTDTDIDFCAPSPCQNGGSCIATLEGYTCVCINSWTGDTCQTCGAHNAGDEICDTHDNDCDGATDEDFDLSSDINNCNACGNNCSAMGSLWPEYGNAVPENVNDFSCQSGTCVIDTCEPGWGDAPGAPADCSVRVESISVGGTHACALLSDQTLKCWGYDANGELGNGSQTTENQPFPTPVSGQFIEVAAGHSHTCGLSADNVIQCWGVHEYGRLGFETEANQHEPGNSVAINANVMSLDAGTGNFTCAMVRPNNGVQTLSCWGHNQHGQLGDTNLVSAYSYVPTSVSGLAGVVDVSAGGSHACAVLDNAEVHCWGRNNHGQLGRGEDTINNDAHQTPERVIGLDDVTVEEVTCGAYHTCVRLSDSTVRCFGRNEFGQLGDGTGEFILSASPVAVTGLTGVIQIDAGYDYACAVLQSGEVWCWGRGHYGQLGDGNNAKENRDTPVRVVNLTDASDISCGGNFSCAITAEHIVKCWGYNSVGQVGTGELTTIFHTTPQTVVNLPY